MSDPVSWLLIEPGWRVVSVDGHELGRVEEVTGDQNADIFDGLSIAGGILDRPRYVPAEQVGAIVEGTVTLTIDQAAFSIAPDFEEPPVSETIEPDAASRTARLETKLVHPALHGGRVSPIRRVLLWLGLSGKR